MGNRIVGVAIILACAACGGGPAVEGSNAGIDYSMSNSYFVSTSSGGVFIVNTDHPQFCRVVAAQSAIFDSELATYILPTAAKGSYPIGIGADESRATVVYIGACAHQAASYATGGSFTLTAVDGPSGAPTHLAGTVDLQFPDGGTLHGPFDATQCPGGPSNFVPYYPICY